VGKGYLLTGPEALTSREQVEIIAEVAGRSVDFEDVTPREFAQAAIHGGTPPEQAHLLERLNETFRARRSVNITDDVEHITGVAPGPSATGVNVTPTPSAEGVPAGLCLTSPRGDIASARHMVPW
jgi:hypothetical protein